MSVTSVIGVVVGMTYVYFFFSLIASGLNEWYARLRNLRGNALESFLPDLTASKGGGRLGASLIAHPLIAALCNGDRFPSYLSPSHFALALIDLAIDVVPPTAPGVMPRVSARHHIRGKGIPLTREERRVVRTLISGETNIRSVQVRIEKWFTDSGERLSGEYKRSVYLNLLVISIAVSFLFGVDSIGLLRAFYGDAALRQSVSEAARAATSTTASLPPLPLGWAGAGHGWWFAGCAITALALTLGAPFWFDLLGRLVNLRQTGEPQAAPGGAFHG